MNAEELNQAIAVFMQAATSAADSFSVSMSTQLKYVDIQDALVEVLGAESPCDLLTRNLTPNAIASLLAKYDFRRLRPELIEDIRLEHSIVPKGTQQRLTEVTIRSKGEIWRVHKNDADPWPSNPHAHNLEDGL